MGKSILHTTLFSFLKNTLGPYMYLYALMQMGMSAQIFNSNYILKYFLALEQCLVFNVQSLNPWGFPGGSVGNKSGCNAGNTRCTGSIPGLGRSPEGVYGPLLQYSCLENPMDREAWWAMVVGSQRVGPIEATEYTHTLNP